MSTGTQTLTTTSLTTAGTTLGSTTSLSITINTTTVTISTDPTAASQAQQVAPPPYAEKAVEPAVVEKQDGSRISVASLRQGSVLGGRLGKEEKDLAGSLDLPVGLKARERVCQRGWKPKVWWRNYERYRLLKKEIREAEREVEVWRARYDGGFV